MKRMVVAADDPQYTNTFHACWQHATKLEDDTFDVPGFAPLPKHDVEPVNAADRDDPGTWCGFCE